MNTAGDNCKIVCRVTDLRALPVHDGDLTIVSNGEQQILR
jgi:hypothetical protein